MRRHDYRHIAVVVLAAAVASLALIVPVSSAVTVGSPEMDGSRRTLDTVVMTRVTQPNLRLTLVTYAGPSGGCLDLVGTLTSDASPEFRMGGCGVHGEGDSTVDEVRQRVLSGAVRPVAIHGIQVLDDGAAVGLAFGMAPGGSRIEMTLSDGTVAEATANASGFFVLAAPTERREPLIARLTVAGEAMQIQ